MITLTVPTLREMDALVRYDEGVDAGTERAHKSMTIALAGQGVAHELLAKAANVDIGTVEAWLREGGIA